MHQLVRVGCSASIRAVAKYCEGSVCLAGEHDLAAMRSADDERVSQPLHSVSTPSKHSGSDCPRHPSHRKAGRSRKQTTKSMGCRSLAGGHESRTGTLAARAVRRADHSKQSLQPLRLRARIRSRHGRGRTAPHLVAKGDVDGEGAHLAVAGDDVGVGHARLILHHHVAQYLRRPLLSARWCMHGQQRSTLLVC